MKFFQKSSLLKFSVAIILIGIFVFLRLYQLPSSLNFFGDIGRDFIKLQNWQRTGKPPFLVPITSVISFNQSAIYFYYLYPFYLLSGGSPFATTYAAIFLYIAGFILGLFLLRKKPKWQNRLYIIFFLITINPVFIEHHRYVWNPSLIAPFLIAAFFLLLSLKKKFELKLAAAFGLCLATAVSLNYSVVPAVFVLWLVGMWVLNWQQRFKLFGLSLASGLLLNLPTLAFELRHNFFLTKKLPSQELLQKSVTLKTKLVTFGNNLLSLPPQLKSNNLYLLIVAAMIVGLIALGHYFHQQGKTSKFSPFCLSSVLLLLTIFLTLLTPFRMHSHYLYGVLSLLFVTISFLPKKLMIIALLLFSLIWLDPSQIRAQFRPAEFTLKEKQACLKQICQEFKQPLYLNLNSKSHNHQALGYIFLARKQNCQVVSAVDLPQQPTNYMAVINQNAQYDSNKTGYYELTIFGDKQLIKEESCSEGLSYSLFKKN